ncbi:MAG TPA: cytochrome C oxidase subunit IV family protein [Thermoanaerobaculia bacterium]|nr:cytochrome C oxidase subunit IV family protein [Thermoanaerobaculia bacterium]
MMASQTSGHGADHAGSIGLYLAVFVGLLVLTATTTAIAFVDLGPFNNVAAIGIAAVKATLVVLFFMHMKGSPKMVPIVFLSGIVWLLVLLAITLSDYFSRGWLGVAGR